MYQEQRLEAILELLKDQEVLTTEETMERFQVSRDTVRRDFAKLTKAGKVKRIHGGVMQLKADSKIFSFNERLKEFTESKKHIAELAESFLKERGTYFFDVSTTVLQLAELIEIPITVYTHSLDNSIMLSGNDKVELHALGGKFYSKNRFFYSVNEADLLKQINFDAVFIGAAGLKDGQVSFEDQEDAYIKQLAIRNAKNKILLAEEVKFGKSSTYDVGTLNDFDYLLTDKQPNSEILSTINVKY